MPRLHTNKCTLISGEGKADRLFLEYLKRLYQNRDSTNIVQVYKNNKDGHSGGSSVDTIREVMCACGNRGREYDGIILLLDDDIVSAKPADLYKIALNKCPRSFRSKIPNNYKFIFLEPCLEGLYLDILEGLHPDTTDLCKSGFQKIVGCEAHKMKEIKFSQYFTVERLTEAISKSNALSSIISLFNLSGDSQDYDAWFDKYR